MLESPRVCSTIALFLYIFILGCSGGDISSSTTVTGGVPGPATSEYDIQFKVDPNKDNLAISPYIYGTNTEKEVHSGIKMYRMGGNRWSTFNWETNDSNSGADNDYNNGKWLCVLQSCAAQNMSKAGEVLKLGVRRAFDAAATPLVTIPIGDYVAGDSSSHVTQNAVLNLTPWKQNKSLRSSGTPVVNPNTSDGEVYQEESIKFAQEYFLSDLALGKKIFYMLDNEPGLWASNHRYIHPAKTSYVELVNRTIEYGSMVKSRAPASLVFGGVAYGYNEFNSLQDAPDRNLGDSSNIKFFEYFLTQLKNEELVSGKRVMDVLDMHWGSEVTVGGLRISQEMRETPNSEAVIAARLQAPRSLWDPTYTENSWITEDMTSGPIHMIPTLKAIINRSYPGTKISFSEYAHGGETHISGGLAQVDTLGIFGREGVFAAAHWDREPDAPYIYGALKLYTNYDGLGSQVGDISVRAEASDRTKASIYAMTEQGNPAKLFVIVINKTSQSLKSLLSLSDSDEYSYLKSFELRASASPVATVDLELGRGKKFEPILPGFSATLFIFEK